MKSCCSLIVPVYPLMKSIYPLTEPTERNRISNDGIRLSPLMKLIYTLCDTYSKRLFTNEISLPQDSTRLFLEEINPRDRTIISTVKSILPLTASGYPLRNQSASWQHHASTYEIYLFPDRPGYPLMKSICPLTTPGYPLMITICTLIVPGNPLMKSAYPLTQHQVIHCKINLPTYRNSLSNDGTRLSPLMKLIYMLIVKGYLLMKSICLSTVTLRKSIPLKAP